MSPRRARPLRLVGIAAVIALAGCAIAGLQSPRQALLAYLTAYVFVLAPVLGSVAMLFVHALTGGRWGFDLRPALLAATRVLPLLAVLLLPILLAAPWLYPWATAQAASDPALAPQHWYLNLPFFRLRAVLCFALWLWLAHGLRRRLPDPDRDELPGGFAAAGLIVYALTVTVAAVDWIMSLLPQWHSSIFGLTIATGQLLAATALAVACANRDDAAGLSPSRRRDLGSLLMVLVLAWGYLAFMDFLTAWIADLPAETAWYLPRLGAGWRWLGAALVVLHLLLPFAVLLSRRAKQHRQALRGIALVLLSAQAVFALWLVLPGETRPSVLLFATLPAAWIGVGGSCWLVFAIRLARSRPAAGRNAAAPRSAGASA